MKINNSVYERVTNKHTRTTQETSIMKTQNNTKWFHVSPLQAAHMHEAVDIYRHLVQAK